MMKKVVAVLCVLCVLFPVCACAEHYAKTALVVEIDKKADCVVCVDYDGEEWVFDGAKGWHVNDIVSLLMDDKGTDSIYDDEIINAFFGGRWR